MTVFCGCLSSHVCKRLIKGQNSQILRRPQDDSPGEGPVTLKPTPIFVTLRPPKDLAVLCLLQKPLFSCHPEASEGPCIFFFLFYTFPLYLLATYQLTQSSCNTNPRTGGIVICIASTSTAIFKSTFAPSFPIFEKLRCFKVMTTSLSVFTR